MSFLIANPLQPLIDLANTVLVFLHDLGFVYGTAIVLLTFITRALILPLSILALGVFSWYRRRG